MDIRAIYGYNLKNITYKWNRHLSSCKKIKIYIYAEYFKNILQNLDEQIQVKVNHGRGTTNIVRITRQLIEKEKEHQISLHFLFINFKAAFDTILREAFLKILFKICIPNKSVEAIKNLYDKSECSILAGGELKDWFPVNIGVRRGCIMSPSLFNIFMEHVMKVYFGA